MGVQPLLKTKIIHKHTKKVERYQSDRFMRVAVSILAKTPLLAFDGQGVLMYYRFLGESQEVLIPESEEDSEEPLRCQRSEAETTPKLDITFLPDSRNSSFVTSTILNFC